MKFNKELFEKVNYLEEYLKTKKEKLLFALVNEKIFNYLLSNRSKLKYKDRWSNIDILETQTLNWFTCSYEGVKQEIELNVETEELGFMPILLTKEQREDITNIINKALKSEDVSWSWTDFNLTWDRKYISKKRNEGCII